MARPDMAAIFFALYMGLVFLVCMNLVIAVITIAYEEINDRLKMEEKWKHAARSYEMLTIYALRVRLTYWRQRFCGSRCGGRAWASGEYDQLQADLRYRRLIVRYIQEAEANSRTDLLRYVEEVHKSAPPGQSHYLSLKELCYLAREAGAVAHPFCATHRAPAEYGQGTGGPDGWAPTVPPSALAVSLRTAGSWVARCVDACRRQPCCARGEPGGPPPGPCACCGVRDGGAGSRGPLSGQEEARASLDAAGPRSPPRAGAASVPESPTTVKRNPLHSAAAAQRERAGASAVNIVSAAAAAGAAAGGGGLDGTAGSRRPAAGSPAPGAPAVAGFPEGWQCPAWAAVLAYTQ
jgi:hypothetical protein